MMLYKSFTFSKTLKEYALIPDYNDMSVKLPQKRKRVRKFVSRNLETYIKQITSIEEQWRIRFGLI